MFYKEVHKMNKFGFNYLHNINQDSSLSTMSYKDT